MVVVWTLMLARRHLAVGVVLVLVLVGCRTASEMPDVFVGTEDSNTLQAMMTELIPIGTPVRIAEQRLNEIGVVVNREQVETVVDGHNITHQFLVHSSLTPIESDGNATHRVVELRLRYAHGHIEDVYVYAGAVWLDSNADNEE